MGLRLTPARQITRSFPEGSGTRRDGNGKRPRPRAARTHEICFSGMMDNIHSREEGGDITEDGGSFDMVRTEDLVHSKTGCARSLQCFLKDSVCTAENTCIIYSYRTTFSTLHLI